MLRRSRGPAHQEPRRAATFRGFRMSGAETRRCGWVVDHMAPRRVDSTRSARSAYRSLLGCRRGPVRASESVLVMNLIASTEARPKIPAYSAIDAHFPIGEDIFAKLPRVERRRIEPLLKRSLGAAWHVQLFSMLDYEREGGEVRKGLTEEQKQLLWDHMGWGAETRTVAQAASRDRNGEVRRGRDGRIRWERLRYHGVTRENIGEYRKLRMAGPRYSAILAVESDDPESLKELKRFFGAPNLVAIRNSTEVKEGGRISRPGQWHAIWLLRNPVPHRNLDGSETKALTKLRAVQKTITHLTGGDPGFTRGVMRSPFHDDQDYDWYWLHGQRYGLNDLAEGCQRSGYSVYRARYLPSRGQTEGCSSEQQTLPIEGQRHAVPKQSEQAWIARIAEEGWAFPRNHEIFGRLSRQATAWRHRGRSVQWPALMEHAEHLNAVLAEHSPKGSLTQQELKTIVSSVFRWGPNAATRRKGWEPPTREVQSQGSLDALRDAGMQLYGGLFTYEQCRKGGATTWRLHARRFCEDILVKARRRSEEVRRAKKDRRREKIWALHLEGLSAVEIASSVGVHRSTVHRLLSDARRIEINEMKRRERETQERPELLRSSIPLIRRSTNETVSAKAHRVSPSDPSSPTTSTSMRASDASRFSLKQRRRTRKAQRLATEEPLSRHDSA